MSLPAIRAVRANFLKSEITLLAKPSVADIYSRESSIDKVIVYAGGRWSIAKTLAQRRFHIGILFPNSFDSALVMRMGRIPQIVGYDTDMRKLLLSHPVPTPRWKGTVHRALLLPGTAAASPPDRRLPPCRCAHPPGAHWGSGGRGTTGV